MEKLVIIILALAIILFTTPNQDADQLPVTAPEKSKTAVTERAEKVPVKDAEIADVRKTEEILVEVEEIAETNCEPIPTKVITEEKPAVQETPMKTEELKVAEPEETVECVYEGDQSLVEYKPQPSGLLNPFENAPPAEIVDNPVEDLIGEGEDRPGEGKHF